jgi:hypothetical protein
MKKAFALLLLSTFSILVSAVPADVTYSGNCVWDVGCFNNGSACSMYLQKRFVRALDRSEFPDYLPKYVGKTGPIGVSGVAYCSEGLCRNDKKELCGIDPNFNFGKKPVLKDFEGMKADDHPVIVLYQPSERGYRVAVGGRLLKVSPGELMRFIPEADKSKFPKTEDGLVLKDTGEVVGYDATYRLFQEAEKSREAAAAPEVVSETIPFKTTVYLNDKVFAGQTNAVYTISMVSVVDVLKIKSVLINNREDCGGEEVKHYGSVRMGNAVKAISVCEPIKMDVDTDHGKWTVNFQ